MSFCGHTILQSGILLIKDALQDERFCDNPLVVEDPKIRFYAGYPLKSSSGCHLGSLCIIDTKPRDIPEAKLNLLKDFALLVEKEFFEKRKSTAYLSEIAKIQEMHISGASDEELFSNVLKFLLAHTGSRAVPLK